MTELPTPSAPEALRAAWNMVISATASGLEVRRAEVLLGIARELREEAQYRCTMARFEASPPKIQVDSPATVPADFGTDATAVIIPWAVGDKADCLHCHTPIFYDYVFGKGGDPTGRFLWHHKYTGQAVCAVPVMSSIDDESTYTFAEPSLGG